ncbi:MAG: long-chain fatty acid--CoA ligase, partial [Bacteroidales bacterium]|nr:long-chain fatty acid--CoA ligase [Bacteroidales bacterium]
EGIKDCICIPIPHPLMGFVPKLLVVMSDGFVFNKKAIALSLKQKLESYKVPVRYEQVDHVERTYNGKLNRKAYLV